MTCQSLGPLIGVINCGCKGDVDTNVYRCLSFDTTTAFCVVIGSAEQSKEVVKLDGTKETITFSGCNRCRFNSEKRRPKEAEQIERPAPSPRKWEHYATAKQLAARLTSKS